MTDGWKKIIKLEPRFIKSLKDSPYYINRNKKFTYKNREIEFTIEDFRNSHNTTTKVLGLAEDISFGGYGILFKSGKILCEEWNDSELNCWSESNFENSEEIIIRLEELEPYLSYYIPEKHIRDNYVKEIQSDFSTDALEYCDYYFTSDQIAHEILLKMKIGNLKDPHKQWDKVKEIAQEYFEYNTLESTRRGINLMTKSNEIYFNGTTIEPIVRSEIYLRSVSISWNSEAPLDWWPIFKEFQPIFRALYEIIDEKDGKEEIWEKIDSFFIYILDRCFSGNKNEEYINPEVQERMYNYYHGFDEFVELINLGRKGDDKDKLIVKTFLQMLSKNRNIDEDIRDFLERQEFLK